MTKIKSGPQRPLPPCDNEGSAQKALGVAIDRNCRPDLVTDEWHVQLVGGVAER